MRYLAIQQIGEVMGNSKEITGQKIFENLEGLSKEQLEESFVQAEKSLKEEGERVKKQIEEGRKQSSK